MERHLRQTANGMGVSWLQIIQIHQGRTGPSEHSVSADLVMFGTPPEEPFSFRGGTTKGVEASLSHQKKAGGEYHLEGDRITSSSPI